MGQASCVGSPTFRSLRTGPSKDPYLKTLKSTDAWSRWFRSSSPPSERCAGRSGQRDEQERGDQCGQYAAADGDVVGHRGLLVASDLCLDSRGAGVARFGVIPDAPPARAAERDDGGRRDRPLPRPLQRPRCASCWTSWPTALDRPRTFPDIEYALAWPWCRIASVLGGVSHLRHTEFGGRRPHRFHDTHRVERQAAGRRGWMPPRRQPCTPHGIENLRRSCTERREAALTRSRLRSP